MGEFAMSRLRYLRTQWLVLAAGAIAVSGCTESSLRLAPNFGAAVKQDVAAQVADPDAHYTGTPAPGSNGSRVSLAQKRYAKDAVVQPSSTSASGGIGMTGNTNGGGNGDQAPTAGAGDQGGP
jgi:hypothetical protein